MKIHVHDFSGHPFQVELSRNLASRGHTVIHSYAEEYATGRGRLAVDDLDIDSFSTHAVMTGRTFDKYSPSARLRFEHVYGRAVVRMLRRDDSDVVIVCNVPLFAMRHIRKYFDKSKRPWLFWHQDVYSLAISDEAHKRLPKLASRLASMAVQSIERSFVRSADAVVAIAETFRQQYREWGVYPRNLEVIPNWAPIDEIKPGSRENAWASAWSHDRMRLVYAGTLGKKHNPELLTLFAQELRSRGVPVDLIVVSEGPAADQIAESCSDPETYVLPFQPAQALPDVLASADILIALLEPEASRFSVPSKVASYLAAGRPVVMFGPVDNPAAVDIRAAHGLTVEPSPDSLAYAATWAHSLWLDRSSWQTACDRARQFAQDNFDVDRVSQKFEALLFASVHH